MQTVSKLNTDDRVKPQPNYCKPEHGVPGRASPLANLNLVFFSVLTSVLSMTDHTESLQNSSRILWLAPGLLRPQWDSDASAVLSEQPECQTVTVP